MKINVVIACAGAGTRAKLGYNKTLAPLNGKSVVSATVSKFDLPQISRILVMCGKNEIPLFKNALDIYDNVIIMEGSTTRTRSVAIGIANCESDCDIIIVHDGARPYVSREMLKRGIECAKVNCSAIPAVTVTDSLRLLDADGGSTALDRSKYVNVQTPQIFNAAEIKKAYRNAMEDNFTATDDAQIYEKYIGRVTLFEGDAANIKLTNPPDFSPDGVSVGCGFDTHKLVKGRKLILGGVEIPHKKGLLGHSDADVLIHAIMDALLSSVHERDIGVHFPDTDPQYEGISSMKLLSKVNDILLSKNVKVGNISAVIMAQKPKLKDYIESMCKNIAKAVDIPEEKVSVSATTTEGIGLVGREEGISAHATATVYTVS
ncbi:MAG: 2-C-methyl-D-erythritol 2,4-cyclodiphosphate synthase [Clostridia bacterium]|nr:2-C-methyl-D-erythritol 2,4-cyclodiphosphate synthase [Clostridia bacterium]